MSKRVKVHVEFDGTVDASQLGRPGIYPTVVTECGISAVVPPSLLTVTEPPSIEVGDKITAEQVADLPDGSGVLVTPGWCGRMHPTVLRLTRGGKLVSSVGGACSPLTYGDKSTFVVAWLPELKAD